MNKTIIWESKYYGQQENCSILGDARKIVIHSSINNHQGGHVEYTINLNADWSVIFFDVHAAFDGQHHTFAASKAGQDWIVNGITRPEFRNCIDIDITLTPLTNSLPINRLALEINKPQAIEVLYVNVLENKLYPVRQRYMKKSETEYNFQNIPNDFEADITVDNEGFVVNYPQLFERLNR